MAIDVYLQIYGIKGESMDETHRDWIECATAHFGVHQPRSATASTGGGHTAERVHMEDIFFTKVADPRTGAPLCCGLDFMKSRWTI